MVKPVSSSSYVSSNALAITGVVTFALVLSVNAYYLARRKGYRSFHMLLFVGSVSGTTIQQSNRIRLRLSSTSDTLRRQRTD